jgi:hypothetical protein
MLIKTGMTTMALAISSLIAAPSFAQSPLDAHRPSGIPSFLLIDVSDKPIRLLQAASAIP